MKSIIAFLAGLVLALHLLDKFIQITREPYRPGYAVRNKVNNAWTVTRSPVCHYSATDEFPPWSQASEYD